MKGVLRDETLVISIMAGVPAERVRKLLHHDLVLRTTVDIDMLPIDWAPATWNEVAKDDPVLGFKVINESEYIANAARHLVCQQDHMKAMVEILKDFGKALGVHRNEVPAILNDILFGILPTLKSSSASHLDSETSTLSGSMSTSSSSPYRRRRKTRKNIPPSSKSTISTLSRTYSEWAKFDHLDATIEALIWPSIQPAFVACKEGKPVLVPAPRDLGILDKEEVREDAIPRSPSTLSKAPSGWNVRFCESQLESPSQD